AVRRRGPPLGLAPVLYPLAFLTGALTLGAVAVGMLLGHWYLIDLGLSIEPLRRLLRYFVAVLIAHVLVLGATLAAMALGSGPGAEAVRQLWQGPPPLVALRFVGGALAAPALGSPLHPPPHVPPPLSGA